MFFLTSQDRQLKKNFASYFLLRKFLSESSQNIRKMQKE